MARADRAALEDAAVVPVLAAVIRRRGSVLIALRPRHKRHGGLWEFPGGKMEPGESLLEAARREVDEELGMSVARVGAILFEQQDPGSSFRITFVEVEAEGEPLPTEHEAIVWAFPHELAQYSLAPSDRAFALTLSTHA